MKAHTSEHIQINQWEHDTYQQSVFLFLINGTRKKTNVYIYFFKLSILIKPTYLCFEFRQIQYHHVLKVTYESLNQSLHQVEIHKEACCNWQYPACSLPGFVNK